MLSFPSFEHKVSFRFLSGNWWTLFYMFRCCHKEPAHLLGGLLLACFISPEALLLKYLPSLLQKTILLIQLAKFLHQSEGQEDLLWLQRKQLKVCIYVHLCCFLLKILSVGKHCLEDGAWVVNLSHSFWTSFWRYKILLKDKHVFLIV